MWISYPCDTRANDREKEKKCHGLDHVRPVSSHDHKCSPGSLEAKWLHIVSIGRRQDHGSFFNDIATLSTNRIDASKVKNETAKGVFLRAVSDAEGGLRPLHLGAEESMH